MTAKPVPLKAPEVGNLFGAPMVELGLIEELLCSIQISCVHDRFSL